MYNKCAERESVLFIYFLKLVIISTIIVFIILEMK